MSKLPTRKEKTLEEIRELKRKLKEVKGKIKALESSNPKLSTP